MYCSFRDGTKSQTEMVAVSNVLRMAPEVRGMHEPYCCWQDLGRVFGLEEDGGILRSEGVVDMANAIDPEGRYVHEEKVFSGIFVVVTSDHAGSARPWVRCSSRGSAAPLSNGALIGASSAPITWHSLRC